jgi:hypothetical protein
MMSSMIDNTIATMAKSIGHMGNFGRLPLITPFPRDLSSLLAASADSSQGPTLELP